MSSWALKGYGFGSPGGQALAFHVVVPLGYLEWRSLCNLTAPSSFDGLAGEIRNPQVREKLRQLYGHPGEGKWAHGRTSMPYLCFYLCLFIFVN